MEILHLQPLERRNAWAATPMLLARIDCRAWNKVTAAEVENLLRRLAAEMPSVAGRLADVTKSTIGNGSSDLFLPKIIAEVALSLQSMAGTPVTHARAALDGAPDVYHVAVQMEEEQVARACLELACRLCEAVLTRRDFDLYAELKRLVQLAQDVCLGSITGPLVAAARARGIPVRRLDDESLVQLGWGARQHRIHKSFTSRTGKIAEWISLDKDLTKRLLDETGIPVPWGKTASSAEDAWRAAGEVGLPVAIKPRNCDCGNGISLNLTTREQVLAAFGKAREFREQVVVERFVWGEQYRILVVGQRMVAANRREVPRVVGDGERTILELIELANLDPRRGAEVDNDHPWGYICPDEDTPQVLAEQGLELTSIPPGGQQVVLSRLGHLWAGGRLTDVTDLVHPLTAEQCVTAVRVLGLDLAGLDVIARDISVPLHDQGGAILEVNAEPAIVLHFPPYCEVYRPVCEAIVESLIPHGTTGRIPLALVTSGPDGAETAHLLAHLLSGRGQRVGRATSQGLFLGQQRLKAGDQASLAGGRAMLLSPQVECAVMERSPQRILREGLGIDFCDVAILTSAAEPDTAARVVAEAVRPNGHLVLDAKDARRGSLKAACAGKVILVSQAEDPLRNLHGHCMVFARGQEAILRDADGVEQTVPLSTDTNAAVLRAIAAAWAIEVSLDVIRTQLGKAS